MAVAWEKMPPWVWAGAAHIGAKEHARGDNGAIQLMFALAGHPGVTQDEIPWCAAFVGASLKRASVEPTGSLMAKSYLQWGVDLPEPQLGAIAVMDRGSDPSLGHVGFVVGITATTVTLLSGNVDDTAKLETRKRNTILSYRWPTGAAPGIMSPAFDQCLDFVKSVEGEWSDHPEDPGGATMRGVTLERYSQFKGAKQSKTALRNMTDEEHRAVYAIYYWFASFADLMPTPLNLVHFDCAVNQGPGDAARFLQRALEMREDGELGPKTVKAAQAAHVGVVQKYITVREHDYRSLKGFPTFGRGWLNRLAACAKLARAMHEGTAPAPVSIPEPAAPAPEVKETSPTNEGFKDMPEAPKWWLQSKTVWGAIISALSTAAPYLAFFLGFPISAGDIQAIGDSGMQLLQAVGALAGLLLTIVGRVKAAAPIETKPVTIKF